MSWLLCSAEIADRSMIFLEMSHDMIKPTKWVCAQRRLRSVPKDARFFHADSEDSDQTWADAQADLSLCWAHTHFVGFVMMRLKWWIYVIMPENKLSMYSKLNM